MEFRDGITQNGQGFPMSNVLAWLSVPFPFIMFGYVCSVLEAALKVNEIGSRDAWVNDKHIACECYYVTVNIQSRFCVVTLILTLHGDIRRNEFKTKL